MKWFAIFIFICAGRVWGRGDIHPCSVKQQLSGTDSRTKIISCTSLLIEGKKFLIFIKNEQKGKGRGIGIQIFQHGKLLLDEFALGEVFDGVWWENSKHPIVVADITGDKLPDICLVTLNERSSNLYCFQYNSLAHKFKSIKVVDQKSNEQQEMIVGTVDFPIKLYSSGEVYVFWTKEKFFRYKLEKGCWIRVNR